MALWYTPTDAPCDTISELPISAFSMVQGERGHYEWQTPEPCGPASDPHRSHIYRAPRWVPDPPARLYR